MEEWRMSIERLASHRAIEWFCNKVTMRPVDKVFNDVFGNDTGIAEKFYGVLKKIAKDNRRQALRFLELVERTDDIKKWLAFLEHEQNREGSDWENETIEKFIKKLKDWINNPTPQCVRETEKRLNKWFQPRGASLTDEEKEILKIGALRTALYVTLKGL